MRRQGQKLHARKRGGGPGPLPCDGARRGKSSVASPEMMEIESAREGGESERHIGGSAEEEVITDQKRQNCHVHDRDVDNCNKSDTGDGDNSADTAALAISTSSTGVKVHTNASSAKISAKWGPAYIENHGENSAKSGEWKVVRARGERRAAGTRSVKSSVTRPAGKNTRFSATRDDSRPEPQRGTSDCDDALPVAIRYSWIFVSGFDVHVTSENIMQFLKKHQLEQNCECVKMKTRKDKYQASFKLKVPQEKLQDIMMPSLWPRDILINHFRNVQRRHHTGD